MEEPAEHDVLLARIAFGDGWTLLPESFSRITRKGVIWKNLANGGLLKMELGLVAKKLAGISIQTRYINCQGGSSPWLELYSIRPQHLKGLS